MNVHLFQYHILKKLSFLHWIAFTVRQWPVDCLCVGLLLGSLFCSTDLCIYYFANTTLFDYCSYTVILNVCWCQSWDFVLLRCCVGSSESCFPYKLCLLFLKIPISFFFSTWSLSLYFQKERWNRVAVMSMSLLS